LLRLTKIAILLIISPPFSGAADLRRANVVAKVVGAKSQLFRNVFSGVLYNIHQKSRHINKNSTSVRFEQSMQIWLRHEIVYSKDELSYEKKFLEWITKKMRALNRDGNLWENFELFRSPQNRQLVFRRD
jgi:hypothetical protein